SRQVGSRKGIKDVHGIPLLGTMSPLSYFPTLLLSYRLNSYRNRMAHWGLIEENRKVRIFL
ncbi:MAG: hypothetical protein AB1414_10015, partial [bacterium]